MTTYSVYNERTDYTAGQDLEFIEQVDAPNPQKAMERLSEVTGLNFEGEYIVIPATHEHVVEA